jgi:hypothetical protein
LSAAYDLSATAATIFRASQYTDMTDCEVMTAIGNQFDSEQRPALSKTKRSFLQKLTERHDALMLHMRIKTSEELDQDDRPAPSRTSSSSSTQKDLFKISPVT